MSKEMIAAIFAAVAFSWPVLQKYAKGATGFWTNTGVALGTIVFTFGNVLAGRENITKIGATSIAILIACGLFNGFGVANYTKLFDKPVFIPIALVLTQIFILIGMWVCHGDKFSFQNVIGVFLAIPAMYLMTR